MQLNLSKKITLINKYPVAYLFIAYLVAIVVIYWKARNGLLIDDGMAGLIEYRKQGLKGWFNSFGFPSLYYTHDFFVLLIYNIAGKSSTIWFFTMATLHVANACSALVVFHKLYRLLNIRNADLIAFSGSVLFLLSPYQTENLAWAATLHYSISMLIFLLSTYTILHSLHTNKIKKKHVILITGLHVAALTCLEISLVFPAAYFILFLIVFISKKTKISISRFVIQLILPLILTTCLYFIVTKILKGHWVPHYGSEHLKNFTVGYYLSNTYKYLCKYLLLLHFANYHYRELIYTLCEKHITTISILLLASFAITCYIFYKKNKALSFAFIGLCALFFLLLLPSLSMYFMYLFTPENDRLGYFMSLILYQIISVVLISISLYAGVTLLILFFSIGLFFLTRQVNKWGEAAYLHNNLINSFTWLHSKKIYVLNSPSNYKGVYQFRAEKRLYWAIHFNTNINLEKNLTSVLSSAYANVNDSSIVTIVNDSTLNVDFITNGGWLMHDQLGATDYSTKEYSVTVDPWKPSYKIVFHEKPADAVYIYAGNNCFKQVEGF